MQYPPKTKRNWQNCNLGQMPYHIHQKLNEIGKIAYNLGQMPYQKLNEIHQKLNEIGKIAYNLGQMRNWQNCHLGKM
jgi:SpoU rRNA methylase family enzyme